MKKQAAFLEDVMSEIHNLKNHATPAEVNRLDKSRFDPNAFRECIYGQLTTHCSSVRAKELMDKCCIRIVDFDSNEQNIIDFTIESIPVTFEDNIEPYINGKNRGETWIGLSYDTNIFHRNYSYLSALESFIVLDGVNIEGIMGFLKGEIQTIELWK